MKRAIFLGLILLLLSVLAACAAEDGTKSQHSLLTESSSNIVDSVESEVDPSQQGSAAQEQETANLQEGYESMKIKITVGNTTLTAIPEKNSSAEAFITLLQEGPITVQMSDYAGMEKVGPLGTNLPRNDAQISVGAGDVILYQGNQITIYYGTNSWRFTKLAVIQDVTKESLLDILGSEDVDVTFSIAE